MTVVADDLRGLLVPIGGLVLLDRNPRRGDVAAVARSLERFGQRKPVVVRRGSGEVLAGNHTVQAALLLGWTEIAAVRVDDDPATGKAFALADNRTHDLGAYDSADLMAMLEEVRDADAALLTAASYDAADLLGSDLTGDDADEVPEPPKKAVTKPGDMWLLGEQRLLCGDSRERADLDRVLAGRVVDVVVTDPPYGVAIGAKNRSLRAVDRAHRRTEDLCGDQGAAEVDALWRAVFGHVESILRPGKPFYTFAPHNGDLGLLLLLLLLRECKLPARHILVWVKNRPSFSIGRLDYEYAHESILYGWKQGAAHPWFAAQTQTSIFAVDRPQASRDHATTKPVALIAALIRNSAPVNGLVLDPFLGSGTTLIAAQQEHRLCAGVEISPTYCDVICARFQKVTGVTPRLEAGPLWPVAA